MWEARHVDAIDHGLPDAADQQIEPGMIVAKTEQVACVFKHVFFLMRWSVRWFGIRRGIITDGVARCRNHGGEKPLEGVGDRPIDRAEFGAEILCVKI
jgi:hypothetical protein